MFKELFDAFKSRYSESNWQSALIISIVILLFSIAIHTITFALLKHFKGRSDLTLLQTIRNKFRIPSIVFLLTLSLTIIVYLFSPQIQVFLIIKHFLKLIIIFCIAWLLIRFINLGRIIVLNRFDINQKDNLRARQVYTQFRIIERILIFIVILLALAIGLTTFEGIKKIGISIFASAGVAGIILGLAAQKLIGTVLAGFQLAITEPIRIEDVVIVEGEWGWIEEITLTYVVVRIWDLRRLIVPTTYFIEKPFQNWTRISADILGTVFIYTDYSVPINKLREELTRILKSDKNWDGKVNVLQVTDSTEKTVEIRALMSAQDSPGAWNLRVNVREQLIVYLQKNFPDSLPRTRLTLEKTTYDNQGNEKLNEIRSK